MKTYDFSVTYEYVQPYLPTKRSRKIRYAIQTDTTHVSVPIVGESEFPVVIRTKFEDDNRYMWMALGNGNIHEIHGYHNQLYYPYLGKDCNSNASILKTDIPDQFWNSFNARLRWDDEEASDTKPISDASVLLTDTDNRINVWYQSALHKAAEKRVQSLFASFLLFQDKVWKAGVEPYARVKYFSDCILCDWLCPSNNTISSSIWTHCYRVDQINRIAETETAFRKAYAQTHNIGRKYPKDPTEIQKIFLDSIETLPGFSAYLHLGIDNREEQDQRYVFDIQKAESVFKLPSEGQYTYQILWDYFGDYLCEIHANNEDEAIGKFLKNHPNFSYQNIVGIRS